MLSYIALFTLLAPFTSAAPLEARDTAIQCYAIQVSPTYGYLRDIGGPIGLSSVNGASTYYFPPSLNGGLAEWGSRAPTNPMYLTYNAASSTFAGPNVGSNRGNVVALSVYNDKYPLLKATWSDATHIQFRVPEQQNDIVSLKVCTGPNFEKYLSVGRTVGQIPTDITKDASCVDVGNKFEVAKVACK